MKIYTEIGIDFDNNKYGLGISTEFEKEDGTETRQSGFVKMKFTGMYSRFWILKKSFILSSKNGFEIENKNRHNFKWIIIGFYGEPK